MTAGVHRAPKGRFDTKDASRKALLDVLGGFHNNRERYNWTWNAAAKSSMLTKKAPKGPDGKTIKKYNTAGKLIVKTNRLSRPHAYKILLSGASAEAYRIMSAEAATLRRKVDPESAYCPAFPTISDGALLSLEHFCVALCQTYFGRAVSLKNSNKTTQKVTGKMQEMACAAVNEKIFTASSLGPGLVRMAAPPKPKSNSEREAVKARKAAARLKKEARRRKKLGLEPLTDRAREPSGEEA